jgi:hypothetical protein
VTGGLSDGDVERIADVVVERLRALGVLVFPAEPEPTKPESTETSGPPPIVPGSQESSTLRARPPRKMVKPEALMEVRAALARIGGWARAGQVGRGSATTPLVARNRLNILVEDGIVEHNGVERAGRRYRLRDGAGPPTVEDGDESPEGTSFAAGEDPDGDVPLPAAGSAQGNAEGDEGPVDGGGRFRARVGPAPRAAKDVVAERRLRERRMRELAQREEVPRIGTLEGRILAACQGEGVTAAGLSRVLRVGELEVVRTVRRLVRDGDAELVQQLVGAPLIRTRT